MPTFNGMRVIVSPYANTEQPEIVRRTWKERLFSWPWKPWRQTKTIIVKKPGMYQVQDSIVMHPAIYAELGKAILHEPWRPN